MKKWLWSQFLEQLIFPLDEIPVRWEEFRSMPRPLVLFCRSGGRSGQALEFLASKGIDDGMNGMGASDVLIELM